MTSAILKLRTLAELKLALRSAPAVFVRVRWQPDHPGDFVPVAAKPLLESIGADAPADEGGHPDTLPVKAVVVDGELFVG